MGNSGLNGYNSSCCHHPHRKLIACSALSTAPLTVCRWMVRMNLTVLNTRGLKRAQLNLTLTSRPILGYNNNVLKNDAIPLEDDYLSSGLSLSRCRRRVTGRASDIQPAQTLFSSMLEWIMAITFRSAQLRLRIVTEESDHSSVSHTRCRTSLRYQLWRLIQVMDAPYFISQEFLAILVFAICINLAI